MLVLGECRWREESYVIGNRKGATNVWINVRDVKNPPTGSFAIWGYYLDTPKPKDEAGTCSYLEGIWQLLCYCTAVLMHVKASQASVRCWTADFDWSGLFLAKNKLNLEENVCFFTLAQMVCWSAYKKGAKPFRDLAAAAQLFICWRILKDLNHQTAVSGNPLLTVKSATCQKQAIGGSWFGDSWYFIIFSKMSLPT